MTPSEMERLIARHLDGAMSIEEEEEFFIRVAVDGELRRALKAQRIVESALRKKHAAAPLPPASARGQLQAMLAATAPPTAPAPMPRAPFSTTPAPAGMGSISGFGSAMLGALGALSTVAFLSYTLSTSTVEQPRPVVPVAQPQSRLQAPSPHVTPLDADSAAGSQATGSITTARTMEPSTPRRTAASRTDQPVVTGSTGSRPARPTSSEPVSAASVDERIGDTAQRPSRQPVPQVSDKDTIRLKVRIEPPTP